MNLKDYIVVHTPTLETYQIVNSLIDREYRLPNDKWNMYKEDTCKVINVGEYANLKCYIDGKSTIYSFDEWINNKSKTLDENYDYLIEFLNKLGIN